MKLNSLAAFLTLSVFTMAYAGDRNLCDDLFDAGNSTKDQIKKCQEKFGVSETAKAREAAEKLKIETAKTESTEADRKKDNIEIKKFDQNELFEAGFGKPFYAIRGDYRNHKYKEKRITEGDSLCVYLGYEKAIKSIVSAEIWENKVNADKSIAKVNKQGLVIDSSSFGSVKDPELYTDESGKFTVRKYVEISCAKRKDKAVDASADALKLVTEDLVVLNAEINTVAKDQTSGIYNGSRSPAVTKETNTPNGYSEPEWTKDTKK